MEKYLTYIFGFVILWFSISLMYSMYKLINVWVKMKLQDLKELRIWD